MIAVDKVKLFSIKYPKNQARYNIKIFLVDDLVNPKKKGILPLSIIGDRKEILKQVDDIITRYSIKTRLDPSIWKWGEAITNKASSKSITRHEVVYIPMPELTPNQYTL